MKHQIKQLYIHILYTISNNKINTYRQNKCFFYKLGYNGAVSSEAFIDNR